jgi:hypothetical protein
MSRLRAGAAIAARRRLASAAAALALLQAGADRHRPDRRAGGAGRRARVPRYPVRRAPRGPAALAAARARRALAGRAPRRALRPALHAAPPLRRHGLPLRRDERGLSLPQRVGATPRGGAAPAGAGLLLRRRLPRRRRLRVPLRRREPGAAGRGGRDGELSSGGIRVPRAPGPHGRVAAPRLGRLRAPGPGGGAPLGAAQHRRLRRRSAPGHDRRGVGGIRVGVRADGLTALPRPDRGRHR